MSANPIWIAGYFGPVAGASPVWIAPGDGTVPSAVQSEVVSYYAPVEGATAVWIAGFFAPPPAAIGATPITISGWGGSGGGGGGTTTSVWSSSDAAANGMTLSNGGLTVTNPNASTYSTVRGTISHSTGKFYVEFQTPSGALVVGDFGVAAGADVAFGIANSTFIPTNYLSSSNYSLGSFNASGTNAGSSGFTSNYTTGAIQPSAGDVFSIAIDLTAGKYWLARNNVWYGSGAPATGANPMVTIAAPSFGLAYFPGLTLNGPPSGVWTLQSTAASQKYAPPSGFTSWG